MKPLCICLTLVVLATGPMTAADARSNLQDQQRPRRIDIEITEKGFSIERVNVEAKAPVELVFTRKTDKTCAKEISVPSLKLKKPLPLNEAVAIALTPEKDDITFACGMNMLKGKLVVK